MDNTHHNIDTLKSLGAELGMREEAKNLLAAAEEFVRRDPDAMTLDEQVEFWLQLKRRDYRSALAEFSPKHSDPN